jgi:tRNA/tmRNA/rRNA uracil-C5-methylase (TrmA/RlmC/RlmD family)
VKHILFLIISFCQLSSLFSQENQTQTLLKVRALQEKKAEYHTRTNGESDGYRVKIHFSADKAKAKEVQAKFSSKYSDINTYEEYQQPNFVINVGDFKTKLEAYELLKKIKDDFPYAFIVKSKIRPMKL